MKKVIFILFSFIVISNCNSQGNFLLKSNVDKQEVIINGIVYEVDSSGISIPTNYPNFDTLLFNSKRYRFSKAIICNFKPDSSYTISMACCNSLDIIPTSKSECDSLRYWDYEKDFDKIQKQLMDRPFISIRTKKTPNDSIYAWHADGACMTKNKIISTKLWKLGIPPKCFFWNNITIILFFKQNNNMDYHKKTDLEEFLGIDNIVKLKDISFRLFDNERFVLIYDEENNNIEIKYE